MALTKQDEKALNPATVSSAYEYMAPKWSMINHLLAGTSAMRSARETFLPPHPHETPANYELRLNATTLLNMTELTLESLVGKPFSDKVKLLGGDKIPPAIAEMCENIDLQGNDISTFTRTWFREGVGKAFAHILIDRPKGRIIQGRERTLQDDIDEKNRPYWNLISPESVIFMAFEDVNGENVPVHIRFFEPVVERYKYTERIVNQIKVLEPGMWQILRQVVDANRKVRWVVHDSGPTGLNYIPWVTFYANQTGDMMGKPPLEDLGHLNIRHWQSTSDQISILTVARFPMLAVSGAHDAPGKDVMTIGPRQLLGTRDANGKFYYVEHTGAAIQSGADDLEKIEQDMAAYGAEFLRKRTGGITATARALDAAEATSPLQDMTLRFIDAVNTALSMTADWMNLPDETTVLITTDFGPEEVKDVDMRTLNEARRNRDISRAAFLAELKRRGLLADEFDPEEDIVELQDEPMIESPFATGMNVDGSAASNVPNSTKTKPAATPVKKVVKKDDKTKKSKTKAK